MDFPTDATGRVVVVGVLKAFAISIISRAGVHKVLELITRYLIGLRRDEGA